VRNLCTAAAHAAERFRDASNQRKKRAPREAFSYTAAAQTRHRDRRSTARLRVTQFATDRQAAKNDMSKNAARERHADVPQ
jgi:hypothetical protein